MNHSFLNVFSLLHISISSMNSFYWENRHAHTPERADWHLAEVRSSQMDKMQGDIFRQITIEACQDRMWHESNVSLSTTC